MCQKEKQPLSQNTILRIWIKLQIWLTMYVNATVPFVHIKVKMQVLCIYKQAKKEQVNRKGNWNEQTNEYTNKRSRRPLKTMKYIQSVNEKSN